jgi:hypothetical protein
VCHSHGTSHFSIVPGRIQYLGNFVRALLIWRDNILLDGLNHGAICLSLTILRSTSGFGHILELLFLVLPRLELGLILIPTSLLEDFNVYSLRRSYLLLPSFLTFLYWYSICLYLGFFDSIFFVQSYKL